jgi:hypothetical protein
VAEIAEAGVGRKAVVSAELLLGTAIAAETRSWYRTQYASMSAWEVHNIRADVTPRLKLRGAFGEHA